MTLPEFHTHHETLHGHLSKTFAQICGRERTQGIAEQRAQLCVYLRDYGWTLKQIGFALQRDHSTVIQLIRHHHDAMQGNAWVLVYDARHVDRYLMTKAAIERETGKPCVIVADIPNASRAGITRRKRYG